MIDSSFPRAWTYGCLCGPAVVGLRLRTVASRRPRSRRYSRYRRFLRPCAAWFAAAQDITELGINDLASPAVRVAHRAGQPGGRTPTGDRESGMVARRSFVLAVVGTALAAF